MRFIVTLCAAMLAAEAARAEDPVFIDELMETPRASLEARFGEMRRDGCFRLAPDRYLLISMDKKDGKPWRVVLSSIEPCRRPAEAAGVDVRDRNGIELGQGTLDVVEKLGRPDAAAAPDVALRKLGETEYFYICRIEEGCARHTSVLMRDGIVTGIAEWYSE